MERDPQVRNKSDDKSKRHPTEMGIRTPIFVTHAGNVEPLRDKTALASNIDVAPTILKACGIDVPAGMSGLVARVVIDGGDKLVKRPNRVELYNLKADDDDRNDIHVDRPERVDELKQILNDWMKETSK